MHDIALVERLWAADAWPARVTRAVVFALIGSLLLTIAVKLRIPFAPVPLTAQSFVVVVIGLAYGAPLAVGTVALYLAQGALGMPVFADGGGLAFFWGPTAGYLLGFLPAAAILGQLAGLGCARSVPRAMLAALFGDAVIFGCGSAWLAVLIGPERAIDGGIMPFLPGCVLTVALAGVAVAVAERLVPES